MTMMQPDPAAEFRTEKEFRAKVYRMLSLGLDTTEIEGLLRQRIDWALFSEETLKEMINSERKVVVTMPNIPMEGIESALQTLAKAHSTVDTKLHSLSSDFTSDYKKLSTRIDQLADLITGATMVLGLIVAISVIILTGLIILR